MNLKNSALVLVDLQNDFIHTDGAYGRAGQRAGDIAMLAQRLQPLLEPWRAAGGWIVSTHFTLVPGRRGEPFISEHLSRLRPFLKKGDFLPGSWGHELVAELQPADLSVDKIAYSAFYMSRLEWVLQRAGIKGLTFAGIVTNGGVASTLRDAHVRDYQCRVLEDGCAAFDQNLHSAAIEGLRPVARVETIASVLAELSEFTRSD